MKSKFILLSLVIFSFSVVLYAQPSGVRAGIHDSLLFDGAGDKSFFDKNSCDGCKIKITKQKGITYGSFCEARTAQTCGQVETSYVIIKGLIPSYTTEIFDGDTIKTGDFTDSELHLQLNDGKTIHMGRNASIIINKNHCKNPISLVLHYGIIYLDLTGGDKNKTIGIKTERGEVINRGTRYSVEVAKEGDILVDIVKVYEGSVTFQQNMKNSSFSKDQGDKGDKLKKLYEDYQAGKITAEEFAKKSGEITNSLSENQPRSVTVEAGFESRINGSGNPTDPVPFDVSNDPGLIK